MKKFKAFILATCIGLVSLSALAQDAVPFVDEIAVYKEQDKTDPPKPRSTLFIGSSSIRKWTNLADRFPDKNIVRRGLGGSEIWQWTKYYLPDMVLKYKPAKVFIYVGENDLAGGKTSESVFDNFKQIYTAIQKELPTTRVYFMAIKPSPNREKVQTEVDKANALVKNYLKNKGNGTYIDTAKPIFGAGHKGDRSLFEPDMIHLNDKGYDRWATVLKKYL